MTGYNFSKWSLCELFLWDADIDNRIEYILRVKIDFSKLRGGFATEMIVRASMCWRAEKFCEIKYRSFASRCKQCKKLFILYLHYSE